MAIKLKKDLEGSSSVKMSNIRKLDKPTNQFPKGYAYPMATLRKVEAVEYETEKMGVKTKATRLQFTYLEHGQDKKGSIVVSEFAPKEDDKFELNLERLNRRIMHVFETTIGKGAFSNDIEAETFDEYFKKVAEEFNNHRYEVNDKKLRTYQKFPMYIKITYGTGNNANRQQLPLFPNYLERAYNEKNVIVPCSLDVSPKDVIYAPDAGAVSPLGMPGAMPGGMSTSFGGSEDDFPADLD